MAISTREVLSELSLSAHDLALLESWMTSVAADIVALGASVAGITAQLDADAGVTDTDYAANNDPTLTTGA